MTWFAWRQFRTSLWIAGGALVVVAALLAVTGHSLADQWAASCHRVCGPGQSDFMTLVSRSANEVVYRSASYAVYGVPALIGIFWGAPLVAREIEAGTLQLAWNQSITRTRWLATKLAVGTGAAAATAGLLSWAVTAWAHHIDHSQQNRIEPSIFGARGIVPIGYAVFAFVLGVTLGMLIRRTVPAMAATLVIYVAAVVSMPLWIRAHLVPATHTTRPLDAGGIEEMAYGTGMPMQVFGYEPRGAWVLSNTTITPNGQLLASPADPRYCDASGPDPANTCRDWVGGLGLRQSLIYHPASHFWPLQWVETGVFAAAALALVGFCFWWTRRRLH